MKKIWLIIPARSGSKRFPGKNSASLSGRSLVARTVEWGRSCPEFQRVLVTTDGAAIASEARAAGAEVIDRPAGLAGGEADPRDAVFHAVETAGGNVDLVAVAFPTSPIRGPETLPSLRSALEAHPEVWCAVSAVRLGGGLCCWTGTLSLFRWPGRRGLVLPVLLGDAGPLFDIDYEEDLRQLSALESGQNVPDLLLRVASSNIHPVAPVRI